MFCRPVVPSGKAKVSSFVAMVGAGILMDLLKAFGLLSFNFEKEIPLSYRASEYGTNVGGQRRYQTTMSAMTRRNGET